MCMLQTKIARNFFNELSEILRDKVENKLVIGDFNCTFDTSKDRLNTINNNNKNLDIIEEIIRDYYLEDTWRVRNPDARQFTWVKAKTNTVNTRKASRIDFALISRGAPIEDITHVSAPNTDHRSVYLVLKESENDRGRGYWKFNCQLLKNSNFLDFMKQELNRELRVTEKDNPCKRWETLKRRITKLCQNYSRNMGSEKRLIQSQLMEKLDELESNLPLDRELDSILEKTRQDLEEITHDITRGIIFRSKCKWYLEGERNTKYFFSLEKSRYNSRICDTMIHEDKEINDEKKILRIQTEFYKDLYQSDKLISFSSENISGGYKVTVDMQTEQNIPFSIENLGKATKQLNNEKTPGPDGIPIEFYKVFWEQLKAPLSDMVTYAYEKRTMPVSMSQGILNLIPKPKKDSRILKNLRPITLLNSDYKIIEKAISDKMRTALDLIINKDQSGFMKNRRISINIRKLFDLMAHCDKYNIAAQIMSCDFVKCFDRIEKSCILNALRHFNFSEYIVQWIDLLYTNFSVKIQNNGKFSESIPIERSVHQGGACSAEIFLVCVEILAIMLRENKRIKGINVNEIINLLNQFADDLDVTSLHDAQSIDEILTTFNNFSKISGFQLSYEKTSIYRIGSIKDTNAQYYTQDIKWTNEPINVLGVTVCHDTDECIRLNYQPILGKIRSTLNSWRHRDLSLHGKITVVNTLIASLFVYKMTVLPSISQKLRKNIYNEITRFIWNNKKSKIKLSVLQQNKKSGGLNLVNLENKEISIKCSWVQILEFDEKSANLAYNQLDPVITSDIWRCNLNKKDINDLFSNSEFWRDTLQAWASVNYTDIESADIENQVIWWNSHIRIADRPIRWAEAYNKGLLWLSQLYENNRLISVKQAKEMFGLNYMQLYSLSQAIPSKWKTYMESNNQKPKQNFYEFMLQKPNITGYVYRLLQSQKPICENKAEKWEKELYVDIECLVDFNALYTKSFRDLYCITNVPKYRSFQYRLLHRAIITNIHLVHWNAAENDLCQLCKKERETYVHLFCLCSEIMEVWEQAISFIKESNKDIELNMSSKNIILSAIHKKAGNIANLVCTVVKQYIYRQRCLKLEINKYELLSILRRIRNYEKFYALRNGKEKIFCLKWNCQF